MAMAMMVWKFHIISDVLTLGLVVERICNFLPSTLLRYQQRRSRQMVIQLIRELAKNHTELTTKYLLKALTVFFKGSRNMHATESTAKLCLTALNWTTVVIGTGDSLEKIGSDIKRCLIELQSFFVYVVTKSSIPPLRRKMYAILSKFWSKCYPIETYTKTLSDATVCAILFCGVSSSKIFLKTGILLPSVLLNNFQWISFSSIWQFPNLNCQLRLSPREVQHSSNRSIMMIFGKNFYQHSKGQFYVTLRSV